MERIQIRDLVKHRNALHRELEGVISGIKNEGTEKNLQRMKEIQAELREIEKVFRENSTFNAKEFTKFMARFFTLTEDDVYTRTVKKANNPKGPLGKHNYYFVYSKDSQDLMEDITQSDEDLRKLVENTPSSIIIIRGEEVHPFKSNARMKDKFKNHTFLKHAIYELMQLRIDEPELSDLDRYQRVLDKIRKNNATTYGGK
ncbi:MAG: hypothetical protein J6X28_00995 [Bacilli bacterium]|nr:hypothetical protein [Bacilli bacterium]